MYGAWFSFLSSWHHSNFVFTAWLYSALVAQPSPSWGRIPSKRSMAGGGRSRPAPVGCAMTQQGEGVKKHKEAPLVFLFMFHLFLFFGFSSASFYLWLWLFSSVFFFPIFTHIMMYGNRFTSLISTVFGFTSLIFNAAVNKNTIFRLGCHLRLRVWCYMIYAGVIFWWQVFEFFQMGGRITQWSATAHK